MDMWMVYDRESLARNIDYVAWYRKTGKKYRIDVKAVLVETVEQRIAGGDTPVFVLVRTIAPEINRFLEEHQIPVFNSYEVSRICNDKGKTLNRLKNKVLCVPSLSFSASGLSMLQSLCTEELREYFREHFTYSSFVEQEKQVIDEASDFVVKAVDGHGGKQVFSLLREADRISRGLHGHDFVLQPMIRGGEKNRDVRVYVIGRRSVAAVQRSSCGDFRANFSLGGEVSRYEPDEAMKRAVQVIVREFEFGMAGIDFIFDRNNRFYLNEIEDAAGARMLYQCAPEIDLAEQYMDYIVREKLRLCCQGMFQR